MSKQYNKVIKRQRRKAYLKRKDTRKKVKAAAPAPPAPAPTPAATEPKTVTA